MAAQMEVPESSRGSPKRSWGHSSLNRRRRRGGCNRRWGWSRRPARLPSQLRVACDGKEIRLDGIDVQDCRPAQSISELPERADPAPSPEHAAADRQRLSAVLRAIQCLPELQREALALSMDEELRYDQIGDSRVFGGGNQSAHPSRPATTQMGFTSTGESMENITRDVIADLWPLYVSGDATADTRGLVEAYLREDPEFAQTLSEIAKERLSRRDAPSLAPDHELRTSARIKRRLAGPVWLLQLAMVFTCIAFGTIVSDTSFDVSPRKFIATAAVAACFWIAFLVRLYKGRRDVLFQIRR